MAPLLCAAACAPKKAPGEPKKEAKKPPSRYRRRFGGGFDDFESMAGFAAAKSAAWKKRLRKNSLGRSKKFFRGRAS
jgi:hypothetical protein